jgi:DNA processing protein
MAAALQSTDRLAPDELSAWLRLLLTPGVGRTTARRLLAACGGAQTWSGPPSAWHGLVPPLRPMPCRPCPSAWTSLQRHGAMAGQPAPGLHAVLALGHPQYPQACCRPKIRRCCCLQGSERCWQVLALVPLSTALAMVGSRGPTAQGAANARAMAQALAEAGLCIVSGLARAWMAPPMRARCARRPPGGRGPVTIAVVGTGLDQVYPRRHAALARIGRHGLIVSEYPLGTAPGRALSAAQPHHRGPVAGHAGGGGRLQSGSLITARLASEQGREVFAIPGSIHAPQSRGCHALMRQGAKLVETAQDVLEELQGTAARLPPQA